MQNKRLNFLFGYLRNIDGLALKVFYKAPEFWVSSLSLGEIVSTYCSQEAATRLHRPPVVVRPPSNMRQAVNVGVLSSGLVNDQNV